MTRARLRPDERIAELVTASRELLAEVGYERFLPAEVARRCGVSEATVYRYFPTKRELLVRVAETWFDEILVALEPGVTQQKGTYEQLRYVVRYAVEVVRREPTLTRYILNELRPDPEFRSSTIQQLNRRFTGVVSQVLRDAVACGDFRDDVSVELLRDMIFGAIEHQAWAYLRGEGDFSTESAINGITLVIYRGMAVDPGHRTG
ncbi:TetR/AcrR family transcriptional regulator [Pseudonocardia sp. KRD291]|uniref:TetR/AcrR family transcriptional regulator n=1 Tax=Pseudonocardia sp. KRD291 TaxID=2792007 RepID=UPI001C4A18DE|nr:TetR/AcrR family transcriptional regulator [Pseudonocardia sp. KRD291]MBW0101868.1 TetR/AcrR family transcriptional regulator [Pseudonocardia sp. KRD291]